MSDARALVIYQDALDAVSRAIMEEDGPGLMARAKLPHLVRTAQSEAVMETPEDLIQGFGVFAQAVKALGATQLVRLATDATYLSPQYITGHHVTHTLRDALPVIESYTNRMVLICDAGIWKMLETETTLQNPHWPIHMPRAPRDGARKAAPAAPKDDVRKLAVSPLRLYQDFLDALSEANNAGDFDGYCNHMLFPYSSHTEATDTIIDSPEDVRPFFDGLRQTLAKHGADRIARCAESAEFISADLICGYHATEFRAGEACVFGPVKSRMVLKRQNTDWYLKSVTNALQNKRYPYNVPRPGKALVTLQKIQERTRT
ncbi:hypothetical protein [uncultured Roseobacter sp.]|uniref:hypothetical protein n=1 Tax=uncultured Roseobacter sp. TaxID=114847 RepID=UPI002630A0C4|nr:hypothetical protein [uncultured Roseobacter sp.]